MSRDLPHNGDDHEEEHQWRHIKRGTWTGSHATPSSPIPQISDRAGVHLLCAGSNSALTGFENVEAAERYKSRYLDKFWSSVDLSDPETVEELPDP
ncbi:hypothetical protein LCGC14_0042850 [marine sediment metagenome]|uniref:Uncharacterized protein n=2 Tax=root TaxID=1 RepID=A0A7V1BHI5_9RHOB|nr:hypothetical protein [Sulfitobacter litoralis]HDZ53348.1 hypothetical protein [Sulfitobacter litoralis]